MQLSTNLIQSWTFGCAVIWLAGWAVLEDLMVVGFVCVQRVAGVTDSWWLSMLILRRCLRTAPASPFLSAYYPDCVGMSPVCLARAPPERTISQWVQNPDRVSSHCFHDPHNDLIQTLHAESLFSCHSSSWGNQHLKYTLKCCTLSICVCIFSYKHQTLQFIPLFILKVVWLYVTLEHKQSRGSSYFIINSIHIQNVCADIH